MNIRTSDLHKLSQNSLQRTTNPSSVRSQSKPEACTQTADQHEPQDSVVIQGLENAPGLMLLSSVVGAGTAACYASPLLHLGQGSLFGTLAGVGVGTGVGLALGMGAGRLYDKFSQDDYASKGIAKDLLAISGTATGAVVGLVGGMFGANPLVTVPAALIGGGLATAATVYAVSKFRSEA